jgi:hypothetical protein
MKRDSPRSAIAKQRRRNARPIQKGLLLSDSSGRYRKHKKDCHHHRLFCGLMILPQGVGCNFLVLRSLELVDGRKAAQIPHQGRRTSRVSRVVFSFERASHSPQMVRNSFPKAVYDEYHSGSLYVVIASTPE